MLRPDARSPRLAPASTGETMRSLGRLTRWPLVPQVNRPLMVQRVGQIMRCPVNPYSGPRSALDRARRLVRIFRSSPSTDVTSCYSRRSVSVPDMFTGFLPILMLYLLAYFVPADRLIVHLRLARGHMALPPPATSILPYVFQLSPRGDEIRNPVFRREDDRSRLFTVEGEYSCPSTRTGVQSPLRPGVVDPARQYRRLGVRTALHAFARDKFSAFLNPTTFPSARRSARGAAKSCERHPFLREHSLLLGPRPLGATSNRRAGHVDPLRTTSAAVEPASPARRGVLR